VWSGMGALIFIILLIFLTPLSWLSLVLAKLFMKLKNFFNNCA